MKILLKLFLLSLFPLLVFAQNYNISGKVSDNNGSVLTGVNIIISGSSIGTATDSTGKYSFKNLKPGEYVLKFSFIGYKSESHRILLSGNDVIADVMLGEDVVESGQVVVTAGKYEQNISELPVSVSIMQADVLERKNFTNLEDAMKYLPGVNMTDDQLSIRGSSGYGRGAGTRVLVAIDGIPFYTGDTGQIIWESIPVTDIERIEVIKGAASSLYGSGAIGGVINIITKKVSDSPVTYIKALAGGYDRPKYKEWDWSGEYRFFNGQVLSHSNNIGNFHFTASLTRLEDESYRQSSFYHRYLGYFKGNYNFSSASSLNVIFNSMNQRNGSFIYWKDSRNALVPPDADQGERIKSNRYMTGLDYKNIISKDFSLNIKAGYYRTYWEDQTESANNSTANVYRGEVQSTLSLSNNLILVSGIEGSVSDVRSNLFGNPEAGSLGIYSQADIHFSFPLFLSAGIRFDYNKLDTLKSFSDFSPKFALSYSLSDNLKIRSSISAGFRAPSLAEAFTSTYSSGITVKPNPNLKPETNTSIEFGFNWSVLNNLLNLDAAVFQNEFYDYIEPGVDTDGKIKFDNVVRARIQGYELNPVFHIMPELDINMNYTYLYARDIQKNKALKYRPRHIASAGINYKFYSFETGADFRYWSRVEEIDNELVTLGLVPDGELRDNVYVLDLRAGYDFSKLKLPLKLTVTADNILNYYYVELIGNLAPIRNVTLSAEFVF
jgi:iron complex outermembrane receptor protein